MSRSEILSRIAEVRGCIEAACHRCHRDPGTVRLLGVTKGKGPDAVAAAMEAGLADFGENYARELVAKAAELGSMGLSPRWHFIGALQTNKVRSIVGLVQGVQSVDRRSLVEELARRADPGRQIECFVEVNVGAEESKTGAAAAEALDLCRLVATAPGLSLAGLMCMPPYDPDPEESRPYFASLRALRDRIGERLERAAAATFSGLSMGMSHDFDVAIEEGATVVRVGTAIFGHR